MSADMALLHAERARVAVVIGDLEAQMHEGDASVIEALEAELQAHDDRMAVLGFAIKTLTDPEWRTR
ncbi:hypothetical protein ACQCSX_04180 [Pseudarthrobacter sp. P1]|uniref:hypothetical protein n=1 Tax=Pseudarthrobacter sp. P1 TaxID=3418418 RepID=UPI003CEC8A4B